MTLKTLAAIVLSAAVALPSAAADIYQTAWLMAAENPAVKSARASLDSELAGREAQNMLSGLEIEGGVNIPADVDDYRWEVSVGQSFDWPGVYSARRKANALYAKAYSYLYETSLADAAFEATQALIRLAAANQHLELVKYAHDNAERMLEAGEYAFSRGEITVLEFKRMQLDHFNLHAKMTQAKADQKAAEIAVATLNGGALPADIPALPENVFVEPYADYESAFMAYNPSMSAKRLQVQALEADAKVAARAALPSFSVAYKHLYEDETHFNGFSIGITLPQWGKNKKKAAALAAVEAARFEEEAFTLQQNADLRTAYEKALVLNHQVDQSREVFADGTYPEVLRKALEMKKINVLEYINEYNNYLAAASDYIDLKEELMLSMAFLRRYTAPSRQ